MDPKFAALVETLAPKLELLLAIQPVRYGGLPRECRALGSTFSRRAAGTSTLGAQTICAGATAATADQGPPTGRPPLPSSWRGRSPATSRPRIAPGQAAAPGLMLDPAFAAAFVAAKERIRAMEYRYVEEADQNRQALLEIYCAIVLGTPYNDFGTH